VAAQTPIQLLGRGCVDRNLAARVHLTVFRCGPAYNWKDPWRLILIPVRRPQCSKHPACPLIDDAGVRVIPRRSVGRSPLLPLVNLAAEGLPLQSDSTSTALCSPTESVIVGAKSSRCRFWFYLAVDIVAARLIARLAQLAPLPSRFFSQRL